MGKAMAHRSNRENDNLPTPYSMTNQFLERELFSPGIMLEPCFGKRKAIYNILCNKFMGVTGFDLDASGYGVDFLFWGGKVDNIVTNPPWSLWDDFIWKAKEVARVKFAFLGDIDFLSGVGRFKYRLYADGRYHLKKLYMFTRKANLCFGTKFNPDYVELREDGKYPCGMIHYTWYVFENGYTGKPEFNWINNQEYIL